MERKSGIADFILRIALLLWALSIIFPIVWIFYESLKTNVEFFQDVWKLPAIAQWGNYVNAWKSLGIGSSMLNTIIVVGLSMVFGITITTLNAYAFTRLKWKNKGVIWAIIMLSLYLPGINALVPQYVIMRALHLTNSLGGLVILYSLGQSVFDLMVLGSFMQTIPKELEESAFIDGASILRVFKDIIVPLSVPGIVTISIFKFIALYNDFLSPFIYLNDSDKYTIGVNMYYANQLMQYKSDWVTLCAGVIVTMIPSIILYIVFQKRIAEGATLGAIKG